MITRTKDPQDVETFALDYTVYLNGETIQTSNWSLAAGITLVSNSISGSLALVRISGGTSGSNYLVTNTITTSGGRTKEACFTLIVRDCS